MVLCDGLEGKRVFIDKVQCILGQLGNYKQVLVKGKTILRLKGVKVWGFQTPLQADAYQDTVIELLTSSDDFLPVPLKEWFEEIFETRKKAKIEATLDKQSDLRVKLTVKLKPGRPRLEEPQPELLKTIMNLTIYNSAAHEKRQS
ncbi:hypothetical protein DAPPUDRAFT_323813 [Daphnia pulex]|uniref:Uncharacterized protein n=1 Tax=Daphnia pulex TaxID=6669 RepID=E9GZV1_DAPPU|nr:hypothetical protein DAPPUDRAFT_323813 [Daphnia pulex]|eukprot:EFX74877.1 hypothetical protein DAPPUDRAFT_323813 [Daphnia pulex]